jgi:hypothetical protein
MPDYSDLSGEHISGDAASRLTIVFPDGRRRQLRVQVREAEDLATKGLDVSRRWQVATQSAGRGVRKLAKWALASLLAVLVVQAVTKQWSDRQKELELKRDLASDIGTSSFGAFADARTLAYFDPEKRTPERRSAVLDNWVRDEGRIDGIFRAYLPRGNHEVTEQWIRFRDGLYEYLRLACCEDRRLQTMRRLRTYLRNEGFSAALLPSARWEALSCGPPCAGYADAYDWLGREVLRGAPYRAVEEAEPDGFSSGFGDLVHDVIPGY